MGACKSARIAFLESSETLTDLSSLLPLPLTQLFIFLALHTLALLFNNSATRVARPSASKG